MRGTCLMRRETMRILVRKEPRARNNQLLIIVVKIGPSASCSTEVPLKSNSNENLTGFNCKLTV